MKQKGALTVLASVLLILSVVWLFVTMAITNTSEVLVSQEAGAKSGTGVVKLTVVAPRNNAGADVRLTVLEKEVA